MAHLKPRRNKPYRKREVSIDGGLHIIGRAHLNVEDQKVIPLDDMTTLLLAYRMAFDDMIKGRSTIGDWGTLASSLNMGLILAEMGYGKDFLPYFITAQQALSRVEHRAKRTGTWRFDGDGLNAVRLALEVLDEQLAAATKAEIRQAMQEVMRRVLNGDGYQEAA